MRRLEDKVAIVTGGAGGIGSATARRLASEGARVVVADINLPQASEVADGIGAQALALAYDAADVASIEDLVEATVRHFGRLDILHNNAAITSPQVQAQDTTVVDIPFEIWDRDLLGFILRVQPSGAKAYIVQVGRGRRVTIGTVGALTPAQARVTGPRRCWATWLTIARRWRDWMRAEGFRLGTSSTRSINLGLRRIVRGRRITRWVG